MSDFFHFMGNHPILTFFLACVIFGSVQIIFRGYPNNKRLE